MSFSLPIARYLALAAILCLTAIGRPEVAAARQTAAVEQGETGGPNAGQPAAIEHETPSLEHPAQTESGPETAGRMEPGPTSASHEVQGGEAGAAGTEGEEAEEPPELPNLVHLLYRSATRPLAPGDPHRPAPPWLQVLDHFQSVFYALLCATVLIVIVRIGSRRMRLLPGPVQNIVEMFVEGFHGFILGILGPAGERYIPFLGSLFLYIWFMNLFGLVPLMRSPTSMLSTTVALAIVVFLYVQAIGMRRLGAPAYLRHLAGDPRDAIGWAMAPLMFPLHVIGELARPVSLSLRLFGNILGEDVLIGVFAGLGIAVLSFVHSPVGVPLHLPFILLALLMSTVQAFVFTLLSATYIMQVLPHEDGPEEEPREAAVPAADLEDLRREMGPALSGGASSEPQGRSRG